MQAIQIETFGNPAEVLNVVDVPDVGTPGRGEVVIALEASPINMSDLLMISGRYGYRPKLPSIVGAEGVGHVVAVGPGVTHLKQGDRTLVPFPSPAWAERIKVDASALRPLPAGDVQQLAMLGINPATAYLLLTDFVTLQSGAWLIRNSANSGVGRALIAIAKSFGLKTVNVVRREELIVELKAIGGDVVLLDGPDLAKRVAAETGGAPVRLRSTASPTPPPRTSWHVLRPRACWCSTAASAASRLSARPSPSSTATSRSADSGSSTGSTRLRPRRSRRCMTASRRWSRQARSARRLPASSPSRKSPKR
jgi:NADPH:quinone reductase-like Zn-dependent oxidoreductase